MIYQADEGQCEAVGTQPGRPRRAGPNPAVPAPINKTKRASSFRRPPVDDWRFVSTPSVGPDAADADDDGDGDGDAASPSTTSAARNYEKEHHYRSSNQSQPGGSPSHCPHLRLFLSPIKDDGMRRNGGSTLEPILPGCTGFSLARDEEVPFESLFLLFVFAVDRMRRTANAGPARVVDYDRFRP